MAQEIQLRRDTTANWTSQNPIMANGEVGIETFANGDKKFKIGDGLTTWLLLPYQAGQPIDGNYTTPTLMIADQANQTQGLVYLVGTSDQYAMYEYLGTTTGDITDYNFLSNSPIENSYNNESELLADQVSQHVGYLQQVDTDYLYLLKQTATGSLTDYDKVSQGTVATLPVENTYIDTATMIANQVGQTIWKIQQVGSVLYVLKQKTATFANYAEIVEKGTMIDKNGYVVWYINTSHQLKTGYVTGTFIAGSVLVPATSTTTNNFLAIGHTGTKSYVESQTSSTISDIDMNVEKLHLTSGAGNLEVDGIITNKQVPVATVTISMSSTTSLFTVTSTRGNGDFTVVPSGSALNFIVYDDGVAIGDDYSWFADDFYYAGDGTYSIKRSGSNGYLFLLDEGTSTASYNKLTTAPRDGYFTIYIYER